MVTTYKEDQWLLAAGFHIEADEKEQTWYQKQSHKFEINVVIVNPWEHSKRVFYCSIVADPFDRRITLAAAGRKTISFKELSRHVAGVLQLVEYAGLTA